MEVKLVVKYYKLAPVYLGFKFDPSTGDLF